MAILFRQVRNGAPFMWESAAQPAARWHADGDGPVHYLADTPHGAWAEFLRHEEITDPLDLAGTRRTIWAVEVDDEPLPRPELAADVLLGGEESYPVCQQEAVRLRATGQRGLRAPSAALLPGGARGVTVDEGPRAAPDRDGVTIVLFGRRPDLVAWCAAQDAQPDAVLLPAVRHLVG